MTDRERADAVVAAVLLAQPGPVLAFRGTARFAELVRVVELNLEAARGEGWRAGYDAACRAFAPPVAGAPAAGDDARPDGEAP